MTALSPKRQALYRKTDAGARKEPHRDGLECLTRMPWRAGMSVGGSHGLPNRWQRDPGFKSRFSRLPTAWTGDLDKMHLRGRAWRKIGAFGALLARTLPYEFNKLRIQAVVPVIKWQKGWRNRTDDACTARTRSGATLRCTMATLFIDVDRQAKKEVIAMPKFVFCA